MNMIDYILQGFFLSGSKLFAVNKNTMEIYEYIVIYLHTFFLKYVILKRFDIFPLKHLVAPKTLPIKVRVSSLHKRGLKRMLYYLGK